MKYNIEKNYDEKQTPVLMETVTIEINEPKQYK